KTEETDPHQGQRGRLGNGPSGDNLHGVDGRAEINRQGAQRKDVAEQAGKQQVVSVVAVAARRLNVGALEAGVVDRKLGDPVDRVIAAAATAHGVAGEINVDVIKP